MAILEIEHPEPHLTVLRLNRPETLNALSWELVDALHDALDALDEDQACRVVVLTGTGRGFCSGLDLRTAGDGASRAKGKRGVAGGFASQKAIASLYPRMRRIPQPIIAAVNGPAYGGGFALALASDLRIASDRARFCTRFIELGLSGCDVGVSYLLPKLVGGSKAHELMLTARVLPPEEAHRLGLVVDVVTGDELMASALDLARHLCRFSPFGLAQTKEVMWANLDAPSLEHAIHLENRTQILASSSGEVAEAAAAFFEKREPRWD